MNTLILYLNLRTNQLFRLMKFKHYSFLIFVLGFGCKEEPKETVFTDFCSNIHRNDKLTLTEELQGLAAKMQTQTGVYVLEDGSGSMVARAWLTEYA